MTRSFNIILLACALSPSHALAGCPAYLNAKDLPKTAVSPSEQWRLYTLSPAANAKQATSWTMVPLQVTPLDAEGVLDTDPDDGPSLNKSPLRATDRFEMAAGHFGPRRAAGQAAPCHAVDAYELQSASHPGTYAYLVACSDLPKELASPVQHDRSTHHVVAQRYDYEYQPNNQLMYRTVKALQDDRKSILAGSEADLAMHLDVRNFFALDFTNEDVESYVSASRAGPVGVTSSIDFFLRVLFFKVNLKMSTTAGFYGDSAHVPTVIDVPLDAPSTLHPGSGILYTWKRDKALFDQSNPDKTLPNAVPAVALSGWAKDASLGLPYCHGDQCTFRLRGLVGKETFGLDVNLARSVVAQGFFPQWVPDVGNFKRQMGWDDDPQDSSEQIAVYFDNSGLITGRYSLDQWLRIGSAAETAGACPDIVTVMGRSPFLALPAAH